MSKILSVYSESVEKKFQEWKEKYEIPEHQEFNYKTLIALQGEYAEISRLQPDHTKRRMELLHMIERVQRELKFKKIEKKNKEKIKVLIACRANDIEVIHSMIEDMLRDDTLKDSVKTFTRTPKGLVFQINHYEFMFTDTSQRDMRGMRFHELFNMTGKDLPLEVLNMIKTN